MSYRAEHDRGINPAEMCESSHMLIREIGPPLRGSDYE